MFTLILCIVFGLAALSMWFFHYLLGDSIRSTKQKVISLSLAGLSAVLFFSGSISYNDAGKCTHVQTIFGTESGKCDVGWYFSGWGVTTEYPYQIEVVYNTENPYIVKMADNWTGEIHQASRFIIPQDMEQFIRLHRDFRSLDRLVNTVLKPAVTSSLDSIANLYSMEEYYAGGKRDEFKTEFRDAVTKGRAKVKQTVIDGMTAANIGKALSTDDITDESEVQNNKTQKIITEKVISESGDAIRERHDYMSYGITVASAIVEYIDPDDKFEQQIQARKDAASRRIVAQEQRREQDELRLLALQTGETDIAKRQASAKVEQIQKTTDADTSKKLAIIAATQQKEQAEIQKETAKLALEKAKLDAETQKTLANAEAYAKKAVIEADGALDKKLAAYVETSKAWADAVSKMNVPTQLFGGGANGVNVAGNTAEQFMQLVTAKTAKDLSMDLEVKK